jgi:solute carrier family 45 protein 1/2/4
LFFFILSSWWAVRFQGAHHLAALAMSRVRRRAVAWHSLQRASLGSRKSFCFGIDTLHILMHNRFTWGIEMTYCTPYLLNLGLTKSRVSLVWIAGPLSGLITQPIVGVLADRSTSKYGRRRPFIVVGTIIASLCLLLLGFTTEFLALFVEDEHKRRPMAIALAVLSIYGVDFAINAVQSSARGLIVDVLPASKQQISSAWAGRMVAFGHLIGYAAGAIDLGRVFGNSIGTTQFQRLTVVAAVFLCMAVGLTCWAVEEKPLVVDEKDERRQKQEGALDTFKKILTTALHLPTRIRAICWIQFWCWIGWFPFLFYTTQFIGEVYLRYNAPPDAREHPDTLGQVGRVGSLSLVVFSTIHFTGSVILPWFIESPAVETPEFTPRPPESMARFLTEMPRQ